MKISFLILTIISIISGFLCAALIFKQVIDWRRIKNLGKNVISFDDGNVNESFFGWLMRNGVSFLNKPANIIIKKFKIMNKLFSNIVVLLEDKKIQASSTSVASVFIFFSILMAMILSLVFNSLVAGLATVLFLCVCLGSFVKAALDKKSVSLRNSIPETLRFMSSCFGAGYTLYQTFTQISNETKGTIHKLFSKCSNTLQTGGSVSESLECLKKSTEAPELAFIAVALDVQHQTGGSIKPVIESAKDMVESKLELMRMLQVQTAQAKLSARIVTILPFALVALFSIISPGFLSPFFASFLGVFILSIAILMQAAGIILVKKMLNVEI